MAKNINHNLYIADIDQAVVENRVPLSSIFTEMQTIILESSRESIIGKINKMRVVNDLIFILDGKSPKSIKVFSLSGKFVREIGVWGHGPGEYVGLSDFAFDTLHNMIYVMDPVLQKVHKYNFYTGEYLRSYNLKGDRGAQSYNIACLGEKIYADTYFPDKSENHYIIREFDLNKEKQTEQWLNIQDHNNGWHNHRIIENNVFHPVWDGTYRFVQRFMDTVMIVNESGVMPYLAVKSKDIITSSDLRNTQNNPKIPDPSIFSIKKIYGISGYIETDKKILFKYKLGTTLMSAVYDKEKHTTTLVKMFRNDFLFSDQITNSWYPSLGCVTSQGALYYVNTNRILDLRQYAEDNVLAEGVDKLEKLKQLTPDSNPVIFYCKY